MYCCTEWNLHYIHILPRTNRSFRNKLVKYVSFLKSFSVFIIITLDGEVYFCHKWYSSKFQSSATQQGRLLYSFPMWKSCSLSLSLSTSQSDDKHKRRLPIVLSIQRLIWQNNLTVLISRKSVFNRRSLVMWKDRIFT